jgi:Flp pilus assembly pilin Flp
MIDTQTEWLRDRLLLAFCWLHALGAEGGAWLGSRGRAQNTVEYALVAAGAAVVALAVIGILSGAVQTAANSAAGAVTQAASGATSGAGGKP